MHKQKRGGSYRTKAEACDAVLGLGLSHSSRRPLQSKFRHAFRRPRGQRPWHVTSKGTHIGRLAAQQEAADTAAEHMGLQRLEDLELNPRPRKRGGGSCEVATQHSIEVWRAYQLVGG